ncbi:unnamed protein product, partial [Polarella glacialis]
VLVQAGHIPETSRNTIRCTFGTITVMGEYVNSTFLRCVSPPVVTHGEVNFIVTLNLQDFSEANTKYLYYANPRILQVDPPIGPSNKVLSVRLIGENFISTNYLQVRFGGVSIESPGMYLTQQALAPTTTEAIVSLPRLSHRDDMTRVPLYISNNGQNFAPEGVKTWDADESTYDDEFAMAYFIFHEQIVLKNVDPEVGMIYGGGFVSVFGYGFLNTSGLKCSFEWIGSPSVVYMSSTHIMCEVPNMLVEHSSQANGYAKLRVTLNNRDWSRTAVRYRFLGECPMGHYVQHYSAFEWTSRIMACPVGHFCESPGMSIPSPCPPGTYMPYKRQVQCQLCPKGFFCPKPRMIMPLVCRKGWVCDELGLVVPWKRCPAGYYCEEGVASRTARETLIETKRKPRPCPPGLHCLEGALSANVKPHNYSTAQACFQGFFCPPGSKTPEGAGGCPLGKYCPTPRHTGLVCPERYMCGPLPAQQEPVPCPEGTFNPFMGQWNCTVCLEGGICPRPRLRMPIPCPCGYECSERGMKRADRLCPAGLMCEEGVATTIEPMLCEMKTFDPTIDTSLDRERRKICVYGIGQTFVDVPRLLSVPKVRERFGWGGLQMSNSSGMAACCWTPDRIEAGFEEIALKYKSSDVLITRSFRRLASETKRRTEAARSLEFGAAGFDGLAMLNVTEHIWRVDFGVIYPKARALLLHYLEKLWTFQRPLPCSTGSYCNEGTCPRYFQTGVVNVDFETASSSINESRRLTETFYGAKLRRSVLFPNVSKSPSHGGSNFSQQRWKNHSGCGNGTENAAPTNCSGGVDAIMEELGGARPEHRVRVLSELKSGFKETLGALPTTMAKLPLHQLYAPGEAIALAEDVAVKQLYEQHKKLWRYPKPRFNTSLNASFNSSFNSSSNASLSSSIGSTFVVFHGPRAERRLQQTSYNAPLPANNPLAIRAPQQCMAGTFCDARAASSDGTGLCPPGKFCAPGADIPQE